MRRRRSTTTGHRASRALAVLTLSMVLVGSLTLTAHAETYRSRLLHLINHARTQHDRRLVRLNRRLSRDAKDHTRQMLRRNRLFDVRDLSSVLAPYDWSDIGADVVGCGGTLRGMQRALMRHAFHRKIILNRKARRVGIGVIKDVGRSSCGRNTFWATEIYYG